MTTLEHAAPGEALVARKLIRRILARGWLISVYDGEEYSVKRSNCESHILRNLCQTGLDDIFVMNSNGEYLGRLMLVWGNDPDGSELIADHSVSDAITDLVDG